MEIVNSTTDFAGRINGILQNYCSANIDDTMCIAIKLRHEMTLSDADYVIRMPENLTNIVGKGKYMEWHACVTAFL